MRKASVAWLAANLREALWRLAANLRGVLWQLAG